MAPKRRARCRRGCGTDATADADLLARLFEAPVAVVRAEVAPPPNTRHIAVRTGKRYGKTSLTARHGPGLSRASAECRYLLRELGSRWGSGGQRAPRPDHPQGLQVSDG